jgi:hypothetical protein
MSNSKGLPMKTQKNKTTNIRSKINTCATRQEYLSLCTEIRAATKVVEFLPLIAKLMKTPRYKTFKANKFDTNTGKAVNGSWVVDKTSVASYYQFLPSRGEIADVRLTPKLVKELAKLLEKLKASRTVTIVNINEVATLSISHDRVTTGGGHNDSTTWDSALMFYPVADVIDLEV